MKRPFWLLLGLVVCVAVGLLAGCGGDSGRKTKDVASAVPPLLDRELFFGDPEISGAQLSPDGRWVSFIKPYAGARNIWIKTADEPFDQARPLTADKRPVPGYFWSRDSRFILYVQDRDGDENFHVWSVDPAGEVVAETGVPAARNLTPIPGARASILSVPKNTPDVIMVGLNDRDPSYHDVYRVAIATGERELVRLNTDRIGNWVFDFEGGLRLATRALPDGGNELLRVDLQQLTRLAVATYEENLYPVHFHSDLRHVYVISNVGDVDLTQLMLMDVQTGDMEFVERDPAGEVDFGGPMFHPETHELLATFYVGDRIRVYPKTDFAAGLWDDMRKALPDGEISPTSLTEDMSKILVSVARDVDPGSVYLYDATSKKATLQYRSRPELPSEHLAPMKPVRFTARDGLTIYGYLTVPLGKPEKSLPVVMYIHGGPWARDYWGYDPYAQFLANRGYAVMQVNFRGSSGYGKHYLNAGNREWGIGAMQHDITDAVNWLVGQGIADPAKVAIFGGSYGGYATLAGVAFTPDLYACAIPYVAPSNLITLIESFPEYWKPFLEGSWYRRVGNPSLESDRADLIARSPLFASDKIKVPLLVVHGANDPRVTQVESDQIVVALREKGQAVTYLVAPDEGHGFRAPNNRKALAVAMEKFLSEQLGGRYQEDVNPETQARLDEILVDVGTVTVTRPGGGGS